jgi:hypothetical protein
MSEIAAQLSPPVPDTSERTGNAVPRGANSANAAEIVWQWRRARAADAGEAQAKAAAAARKKGLFGGVIGLLAAAALYFWLDKPRAAAVVASIAVLSTLLALVSPLGGFHRLQRALAVFARGVGLAMTWFLMTLAYYLLFLPVGLLLRAGGKLRITRGRDAARASYWQEAQATPAGLDAYRKPF